MMMSANTRLQEMQSALEKRGVKDVKFCFSSKALASKPSSEVSSGVADFLDAYLCGRSTKVERIGDAPTDQVTA